MIISEQTLRALGLGPLGRDIYAELESGSWAKATIRGIEDLAAAIGNSPGSKRSRNEDRAVIAEVSTDGGMMYRVGVICDGVGGSEMGDVAATIAVTAFLGRLQGTFGRRPLENLLAELIQFTDVAVRTALRGKGSTTMSVIVAAEDGDVAAANIGDSRVFSWKPGEGLTQVSMDDTMENEFRNLAIKDPSVLDAKGLRGTLSQAIGDMGPGVERLRIVTFSKHHFPAGAILATDGIWKGNEATFNAIARNATNGADAVKRALSVASWSGGLDNASIIAIDNLMTFANGTTQRPKRYSGISLWLNDTKTVIRHPRIGAFEAEPTPPKPKAEQQKKGGEDKRRRSRADYQHKHSNKLDNQLSFIQDSGKTSHKPKIEISTDFGGEHHPP